MHKQRLYEAKSVIAQSTMGQWQIVRSAGVAFRIRILLVRFLYVGEYVAAAAGVEVVSVIRIALNAEGVKRWGEGVGDVAGA